ncbi:MAG: hypothetical protein AAGA77_25865 [Bacteroidota bacterium]
MNVKIISTVLIFACFFSIGYAQCNIQIKYDESGNRIFRGNACDPECSTQVVNKDDIGVGSLRNAIFCAEDGDNVTFQDSLDGHTINLETGAIVIDKSIQINELELFYSPKDITLRAVEDNKVMEIEPNETVVIDEVNMVSRNGFDDNPRILLNHGTLTLKNLTLTDDGAFQEMNSTLLNLGVLNIIESVNLIYAYYQ